MSNYLLQIHVLIEVRRCGSGLVLHIKHPSIPKPVWHKLTEPMYCPFSSTFRRCIFVRQVELAPGRFVLPSGHARTQPARAFPAQTVKTGWTLLSTGSVVVLGLCVASSNTVQTSRRLRPKTKRAMQGESLVRAQRVCEGI